MKTIVLASNNNHKIKEFKQILSDYEILSLNDIGYFDEIIENGKTFAENALIKARAVKSFLNNKNYLVIADDSGLCVNALNGEPGVYSARYAGNHNDKANRDKLINALKNKQDKSAYFSCRIAVIFPNGIEEVCSGEVHGAILNHEVGDTSFGYDCIFYSNELNSSFGECSSEQKNSVSHRGRAINELQKLLKNANFK